MKDDLDFPQWRDVLFHSELPKIRQESFTVTLRWYLSFCKRSNIRVNVYSAREFIHWAFKEKNPTAHCLKNWKEAIRWFFREAKKPAEGSQLHPTPVPKIEVTSSDWRRDLIQVIRRRHYSNGKIILRMGATL